MTTVSHPLRYNKHGDYYNIHITYHCNHIECVNHVRVEGGWLSFYTYDINYIHNTSRVYTRTTHTGSVNTIN